MILMTPAHSVIHSPDGLCAPAARSRFAPVRVLEVSPDGIHLWVEGVEHFLPFRRYPWFEGAGTDEIADVQLLQSDHLYWPELDVNVILPGPRA